MKATELCFLAQHYGTDKTPALGHPYTPFYHRLLRGRQIRRVLEIGVNSGASLRMWRDYFIEAEIFGLDIEPGTMIQEERIFTLLCDAGNAEELKLAAEKLGGSFDLIVDDASHVLEHQILGVEVLLPFLAEWGVYVIEDVADLGAVASCLSVPFSMQKFMPQECDHCLAVIDTSTW